MYLFIYLYTHDIIYIHMMCRFIPTQTSFNNIADVFLRWGNLSDLQNIHQDSPGSMGWLEGKKMWCPRQPEMQRCPENVEFVEFLVVLRRCYYLQNEPGPVTSLVGCLTLRSTMRVAMKKCCPRCTGSVDFGIYSHDVWQILYVRIYIYIFLIRRSIFSGLMYQCCF